MGISVSESNAVREQKQKSKLKSQLKKQQIRNQLANGPDELGWKNRGKENAERDPSATKVPQYYQNNDAGLKKEKNGSDDIKQQFKGGTAYDGRNIDAARKGTNGYKDSYMETGQPGINGDIHETVDKPNNAQYLWEKYNSSETPIKATKKTPAGRGSIHRQIVNVQNIMQGGQIYESPAKVNQGMREPPTTAPKTNEKCDESFRKSANLNINNQRQGCLSSPKIQINRVGSMRSEFDQFDWTIPGEESIHDQMMRKDQLPSMNLVLANKFNENMREFTDLQEETFKKNRRQMMRQLLAGKRQVMEDSFKMPTCCNMKICF